MKQTERNFFKFVPLMVALAIMIVNCLFASVSYAAEVVIIANTSVGDATLTKKGIRDIYLGKQVKWADGSKIYLSALKKSDIHKKFTKNYLSKNPAQFRMYWKKMVFTGKGRAPESYKSEADILKYVAETEGAIGYISSGISPEKVKLITVSDN